MAEERKPETEERGQKVSPDEMGTRRELRQRPVTRSPRDKMLRPGIARGFETK